MMNLIAALRYISKVFDRLADEVSAREAVKDLSFEEAIAPFEAEPEPEPHRKVKYDLIDNVSLIMGYEDGSLGADGVFVLFSRLIANGQAWSLQGSIYGRPAAALIEDGWISEKGEILRWPPESEEEPEEERELEPAGV